MILGFMRYFDKARKIPTNFMVKIINQQKIHSFRIDKHKRWKAGRVIDFCYGVRTKSFERFWKGSCDGIQEFAFHFNKSGRMYVHFLYDGEPKFSHILNRLQEEQMAKNDGFDSYKDFQKYFQNYPRIEHAGGIVLDYFIIRCIHWTPFRYKYIPIANPST